MTNENAIRRLLLISAMIALLLLAFLFDFIMRGMQISNYEGGFALEPMMVLMFPFLELVIVLGCLGLFRYVFSNPERSRLVAALFLIFGLLVLAITPLLYFLMVPVDFYVLVDFTQPGTYLFQTAAMLAATGLLSLVRRPAAVPIAGSDAEPAA